MYIIVLLVVVFCGDKREQALECAAMSSEPFLGKVRRIFWSAAQEEFITSRSSAIVLASNGGSELQGEGGGRLVGWLVEDKFEGCSGPNILEGKAPRLSATSARKRRHARDPQPPRPFVSIDQQY
jgi:hypothetical protein